MRSDIFRIVRQTYGSLYHLNNTLKHSSELLRLAGFIKSENALMYLLSSISLLTDLLTSSLLKHMIVRLELGKYYLMIFSSFKLLNMLNEFHSCLTMVGFLAIYSRFSKSFNRLLFKIWPTSVYSTTALSRSYPKTRSNSRSWPAAVSRIIVFSSYQICSLSGLRPWPRLAG